MKPEEPYHWQGNPQQAFQPNQAPSTPANQPNGNYDVVPPLAPAQQRSSGHNPYEFIMNANNPPNVQGGGSLTKRIIIAVASLSVLVVVGGLIYSALLPKDSAKELYIALAKEQTELVRIATTGTTASSERVKGASLNMQLSIGTNQSKLTQYMNSKNIVVEPEEMAMARDSKNDKLLADAKTTNTFDTTLATLLESELKTYMNNLNTAYTVSQNTEAKEILITSYRSAELLQKQIAIK